MYSLHFSDVHKLTAQRYVDILKKVLYIQIFEREDDAIRGYTT